MKDKEPSTMKLLLVALGEAVLLITGLILFAWGFTHAVLLVEHALGGH